MFAMFDWIHKREQLAPSEYTVYVFYGVFVRRGARPAVAHPH